MVSYMTSVGGHMPKCLGRCAAQVVSFDHVFKQLKKLFSWLFIKYAYAPYYRGSAFTSSHPSNRCYATILIGKWTFFLLGLMYQLVKLVVLATILQVASLSCTGMLTVMSSSLHNIKLKLNACSVPRSELVEQALPYIFTPLKMAVHTQKYAEICRNCLLMMSHTRPLYSYLQDRHQCMKVMYWQIALASQLTGNVS